MKVILHELACKEFRDGMLFYDDQESGLGVDFIDEVNQGLKQIAKHSEAWPMIYENIRAYQVPRFGFRIIYCTVPGEIIVLAVCHCARQPLYWIDRLEE